MERFILQTGRLATLVITAFPLSSRFLDENYRDDEANHWIWGISVLVGGLSAAAAVCGSLLKG